MYNNFSLISEDNISIVSINRPNSYNSLNEETLKELFEIMSTLAKEDSIKAIILTGKGKAFCSGGDLKSVLEYKGGAPTGFSKMAAYIHLSILEIMKMNKPVIGAINGIAAGGGFSLALACDFRIMAESAKLKQAYTSSGLSIDGGGSFNLPKLVGYSKALEIATLDPLISSEEAKKLGLVFNVVPDDLLLEETKKFAKSLTTKSLHSFGLSKKLLWSSFSNSLEDQLELEREFLVLASFHEDGKEGIQAFIEKRKPKFG